MRITYRDKDKPYLIDRAAYTAFLKEQGFTESAISWLNIYVQTERRGKPHTYGEFQAPSTIFVYTQNSPVEEVNDTLLHETRHYWKQIEREQRRDTAYRTMKSRAYQKFLASWLSEPGRELQLDYWLRPSEQDARAYAVKHKDMMFISLNRKAGRNIQLPDTLMG
jgi:hypothetical protein